MIKLSTNTKGNEEIYSMEYIRLTISSEEQTAINHADIFLLLLNNTSRVGRKEFELQKRRSMVIAHRYQCKPNSARTSTESTRSGINVKTMFLE